VRPVGGAVYCHAPVDRPFELRALVREDDPADRWSSPGTRTVYLARDPLVAVGEYVRHGRVGRADERRIVRMQLAPTPALDLCREEVREALGLASGPHAFTDRDVARRLSAVIRALRICEAIVVPSMAFVDVDDRSNVVLFAEALERPLADVIGDPVEIGRLHLEAESRAT
jgi:RES domain-containing protein